MNKAAAVPRRIISHLNGPPRLRRSWDSTLDLPHGEGMMLLILRPPNSSLSTLPSIALFNHTLKGAAPCILPGCSNGARWETRLHAFLFQERGDRMPPTDTCRENMDVLISPWPRPAEKGLANLLCVRSRSVTMALYQGSCVLPSTRLGWGGPFLWGS